MRWSFQQLGTAAFAISVAAALTAPIANADDGWVAVANSPNHEQQDWAYGPDAATAAANALAQCTVFANDLQVRCTWWPREVPEPPPPGYR